MWNPFSFDGLDVDDSQLPNISTDMEFDAGIVKAEELADDDGDLDLFRSYLKKVLDVMMTIQLVKKTVCQIQKMMTMLKSLHLLRWKVLWQNAMKMMTSTKQ